MIAHWEAHTYSGRRVEGAGSMRVTVGESVAFATMIMGSGSITANAITETLEYSGRKYRIHYRGKERIQSWKVIKFTKKRVTVQGAEELLTIHGLAVAYITKDKEMWVGLGFHRNGRIVTYTNKSGNRMFELEEVK